MVMNFLSCVLNGFVSFYSGVFGPSENIICTSSNGRSSWFNWCWCSLDSLWLCSVLVNFLTCALNILCSVFCPAEKRICTVLYSRSARWHSGSTWSYYWWDLLYSRCLATMFINLLTCVLDSLPSIDGAIFCLLESCTCVRLCCIQSWADVIWVAFLDYCTF